MARQALLERAAVPALDMVGRLVAVQAQKPDAPYLGLWARLEGFAHHELIGLLEDRRVVRSSVLRPVVHPPPPWSSRPSATRSPRPTAPR